MAEQHVFIGVITPEEAKGIEPIIERLNGLTELSLIVTDEELTKKINEEIQDLVSKCDMWWMNISEKYNWGKGSSKNWEIDFGNRKVWLIG